MKLESFKDKKVTRRKRILISLGVITIIGVSLLLYKTYAQFRGKVDLDNNNVLLGFYNGNTRLDEMPQKGNADNLVFERAECDNGATVEWNEDEWAPLVKGLTKKKTKCTLYFGEKKLTGVELLEQKVQEEQTKENPELMYDETEDRNLRYVGASPNNYIDIGDRYKGDIYAFHDTEDDYFRSGEYYSIEECESDNQNLIKHDVGVCEKIHNNGDSILWRIIGVMKNVTNVENGKQEDLVKIIRADSIGNYSWDSSESEVNAGYGVNEWSQADIMKLLNPDSVYTKDKEIGNSLYWNNESGKCYFLDFDDYGEPIPEATASCNFTGNGISEEAKSKIAKVRWNTGTFATYNSSEWTASATYKAERGNIDGKQYCLSQGGGSMCNDEVERTTTWGGYIGLMYASDYGYAVGKSVRNVCLAKSMRNYGEDGCYLTDWLVPNYYEFESVLNPISSNNGSENVFSINGFGNSGYLESFAAVNSHIVRPVAFLKSSTIISDALGTKENPFVAF